MLYKFLSDCKAVLPEEQEDFEAVRSFFRTVEDCFIGLMPAITHSLYPVYALTCTGAARYVDGGKCTVFLMPLGGHEGWGLPGFEQEVRDFYEKDEFQEEYGLELEEMLLLRCPGLSRNMVLDERTRYHVICIRLTAESGTPVYLLAAPLEGGEFWTEIVERYQIPCHMVIESHKGMGDWFENVPLYEKMRATALPDLRPRYYFKGLYISRTPEQNFTLDYTIPEKVTYQGEELGNWEKEIYQINWDEAAPRS